MTGFSGAVGSFPKISIMAHGSRSVLKVNLTVGTAADGDEDAALAAIVPVGSNILGTMLGLLATQVAARERM
jgi:hypothetical protein